MRPFLKITLGFVIAAAVIGPLSWQAGKYYGTRRAEAERQGQYRESLTALEQEYAEFRTGTVFPNVRLCRPGDSALTSLYEQLPAGGLLVYLSTQCEGCAQTLGVIRQALAQVAQPKPLLFVSGDSNFLLRRWSTGEGHGLRVFNDVDNYFRTNHAFIVIPAMAQLNAQLEVVAAGTGGWQVDDYVRMLRGGSTTD